MSKSKQNDKYSREIKAQATKLVRNLSLVGETKEQTSAITKGVQRGMEAFLRQQSEKTRELDKKSKSLEKLQANLNEQPDVPINRASQKSMNLPWVLLGGSWVFFISCLGFFVWPQ